MRGKALDIAAGWNVKAKLHGYPSKVCQSRFGLKSVQPVPAKLELKAAGAPNSAKKLSLFRFTAQETARLDPCLYQFAVEARGMGRLTLATIHSP